MKVIISGGGTGGHIYPGMAVADQILKNIPDSKVLFIGTEREVDQRAFAGGKFENRTLKCYGLKGKDFASLLKSLFQLPLSLMEALWIIFKFKPDLVLGVGGYVTGPVLLAAKILGRPTCIHEQNSIPGLANRLAGKFVNRVFLTYPDSETYFTEGKCLLTGNPVRPALLEKETGDDFRNGGITLGVLGGSLGAHRINVLMVKGLAEIKANLPDNFRVLHQTGDADEDMVRKAYDSAGIKAEVANFFEDMAYFYKEVDLIISRAGATSLAEMTSLGKPMLLIPYPHAADNHQRKNAEFMVRGGAAEMFTEAGLTATRLAEEILKLINDKEKRLKMVESALSLARRDALATIVKECQKMAISC